MHTKIIIFDTHSDIFTNFKKSLLAFITILILDYIWYDLVAHKLYDERMPDNNDRNHRFFISTFLSILFLCIAITVQIASSEKEAIIYGAFVGFIVYGFYNTLSLAYLKKWDTKLAIIDTVYGTISTSLAAYIIFIMNIDH
jgi:uncharacterized membrane protein